MTTQESAVWSFPAVAFAMTRADEAPRRFPGQFVATISPIWEVHAPRNADELLAEACERSRAVYGWHYEDPGRAK